MISKWIAFTVYFFQKSQKNYKISKLFRLKQVLKKGFEMAKLKFRLQAMCVVFWEPTTNAPFVANYIKQTSSWNSCERKWNVFDFAKNNFSSNVFEVMYFCYLFCKCNCCAIWNLEHLTVCKHFFVLKSSTYK